MVLNYWYLSTPDTLHWHKECIFMHSTSWWVSIRVQFNMDTLLENCPNNSDFSGSFVKCSIHLFFDNLVNEMALIVFNIGNKTIEHSKHEILSISKTRLDQECSSSEVNRNASCKDAKQLRQDRNTVSGLSFVPLAFLLNGYILVLECSTLGPASFSNHLECSVISFSECSIDLNR